MSGPGSTARRTWSSAWRPVRSSSSNPAWATIPSWYLVAGADNAVGTANERFMARRMHATTVVAKGASHIVMLSQPDKVIGLILEAAAGRR